MKTEIELSDEQAKALEQYCQAMRAEPGMVIRQALANFLFVNVPNTKGSLRSHPAFGSWKDKKIEGVSYQQALREEWPET